jgi:hypothetical protein
MSTKLFENRFMVVKDAIIRAGDFNFVDKCAYPLFKHVDSKRLMEIPTYQSIAMMCFYCIENKKRNLNFLLKTFFKLQAFIHLLDNYKSFVGDAEIQTEEESREQSHFLDECLKTDVVKEAHKILINEGKIQSSDPGDFKKLLWNIWFRMYSRVAKNR